MTRQVEKQGNVVYRERTGCLSEWTWLMYQQTVVLRMHCVQKLRYRQDTNPPGLVTTVERRELQGGINRWETTGETGSLKTEMSRKPGNSREQRNSTSGLRTAPRVLMWHWDPTDGSVWEQTQHSGVQKQTNTVSGYRRVKAVLWRLAASLWIVQCPYAERACSQTDHRLETWNKNHEENLSEFLHHDTTLLPINESELTASKWGTEFLGANTCRPQSPSTCTMLMNTCVQSSINTAALLGGGARL